MKVTVSILLVLVVTLNSCSVKKRSYRPGYYVSWGAGNKPLNHTPSRENISKSFSSPNSAKTNSLISISLPANENELASATNKPDEAAVKKPANKLLLKDSACSDLITLRKGAEIKARVYEISETQVKYRRCDNLDGPLMIINKNDVYSIKYPNGVTDHFDRVPEDRMTLSNSRHVDKEVHPLAYVTLALTIGILILSAFSLIAALIVAPIAKRKILMEPNKYTGLDIVKICQVICWTILILCLVLLIFLLWAMGAFI